MSPISAPFAYGTALAVLLPERGRMWERDWIYVVREAGLILQLLIKNVDVIFSLLLSYVCRFKKKIQFPFTTDARLTNGVEPSGGRRQRPLGSIRRGRAAVNSRELSCVRAWGFLPATCESAEKGLASFSFLVSLR
ncbi:hypothetical protein EVAR_21992_1 [Eumeta japonica]|uniref:Uncharacterized protein n=1 Tax=Eumeta variegata TaxID=151549 RepID=A0A4C1VU73_EUMVA|nr:hypothetical protein EVAR_21992_1 [Eumeta japonica]